MSEGWIKLHRKLRDNPVYTNSRAVHIWNECLLVAAHKSYRIEFCGEDRSLNPGEFVFGRIAWSRRLRISQATLGRWVKSLQRRGMIDVVKADRGRATIYRVRNWQKYQAYQEKRAGDKQAVNTNKNVKNERNNIDTKKEIPYKRGILVSEFVPREWEESRCLEIAKGLGEHDMRFILSCLRDVGLPVIEECWAATREAKGARDRKKYFNALVTQRRRESLARKYTVKAEDKEIQHYE